MRRHVEVSKDLAVPACYAHVEGYLQRHDADLRLRRSVERPWFYVLERRCRRAPAANRGIRIGSDMHVQARDGYIHVGLVNPVLLNRPWVLLARLREEGADLWASGGAQKVADEQDYEARWQKETRRRRRRVLFSEIAREQEQQLQRNGFFGSATKTRFSNVGTMPAPA